MMLIVFSLSNNKPDTKPTTADLTILSKGKVVTRCSPTMYPPKPNLSSIRVYMAYGWSFLLSGRFNPKLNATTLVSQDSEVGPTEDITNPSWHPLVEPTCQTSRTAHSRADVD